MIQGNLQPHTVTISRPTPSKGTASGAEKDTYTVIYTDKGCFVQPVSTSWKLLYSQKKIETSHSVYFAGILTVLNGDKLTFGTRTFRVMGVRNLCERDVATVVDCQELSS